MRGVASLYRAGANRRREFSGETGARAATTFGSTSAATAGRLLPPRAGNATRESGAEVSAFPKAGFLCADHGRQLVRPDQPSPFTLTVDKGRRENFISFCAEGVEKIGPTTSGWFKEDSIGAGPGFLSCGPGAGGGRPANKRPASAEAHPSRPQPDGKHRRH